MASWIMHLRMADEILKNVKQLDRRGFCVGSIAPDCNVENADWTAYTPPKEKTHWMLDKRKRAADSQRFFEEYLIERKDEIRSEEHRSFLLGYYAHILQDGAYQEMIRDPGRVHAAWLRVLADDQLGKKAETMEESWDSIKLLIPRERRLDSEKRLDAEYLRSHPECSYLTVLLRQKEFPDYLEFFPKGAITRKIGIMGNIPNPEDHREDFLALIREEYDRYAEETTVKCIQSIKAYFEA